MLALSLRPLQDDSKTLTCCHVNVTRTKSFLSSVRLVLHTSWPCFASPWRYRGTVCARTTTAVTTRYSQIATTVADWNWYAATSSFSAVFLFISSLFISSPCLSLLSSLKGNSAEIIYECWHACSYLKFPGILFCFVISDKIFFVSSDTSIGGIGVSIEL